VVRAGCDGCGKTFEVPDAGRSYKCKGCGGRVAALGDAEARETAEAREAIDESIPNERNCGECGAIHFDEELSYCEECGASLDGSKVSADERSRRRIAIKELNKAKESVRAVRTLYWVGAFFSALLFAYLLYVAAQLDVPGGIIAFVFGLSALIVGTYIAGAVRIFKEPLLWSTLIAALETVRVVIAALVGSYFFAGIYGLWAVCLWSTVSRVTRVRRLIHKYPELWNAASIARRRSSSRGKRTATTAKARRMEAAAQRKKRNLLIAGGAVVAIVALVGVWKAVNRPPLLEDAISVFVEDWNRSDVTAVTGWFAPGDRSKVKSYLLKANSSRDWSGGLAEIQEYRQLYRSETGARVSFATMDGDVLTAWNLGDEGWGITSVKVK